MAELPPIPRPPRTEDQELSKWILDIQRWLENLKKEVDALI
jgi:hypothetical protein